MEFQIHQLSNGIRLIHKEIAAAEVAHFGIIINAGSRDEEEHEQGLAHFIEHTLFKGTKKRKAYHILSRLDSVGGELNAYTTKELTCLYATFLNEHYSRAMELLGDIVFESVFPEKEISKEKDVIIDEINSYLDNPSEQIFDDFEEQIFKGHPIGRNILGTTKSVKKLKRKDILNFVAKHYTADNIVISSVGNISFKKAIQLGEKYFGAKIPLQTVSKRDPFTAYFPENILLKKNHNQSHAILGNIAYSRHHKEKTGLLLLNNLLGGPAMNSRLNLSVREKFGYTYNVESNYSSFSDTGLFTIYLGTENQYLYRTIALVKKELKKLREKKLGIMQLHGAKKQIIGQLALSEESRSGTMLALGKSLLLLDQVETLPEIYKRIEDLKSDQLLKIANEIFDEKKLSSLIFLGK